MSLPGKLFHIYQVLKTYLKAIYEDINEFGLIPYASALAFFTILSLVPLLAVTVFVFNFFTPILSESAIILDSLTGFIFKNFAASSGEELVLFLETALVNLDVKKIGLIGFFGTLYAAFLLVTQIEVAFNRIWSVKKDRSLFRRFFGFLVLLFGGILALVLTYTITKEWYSSVDSFAEGDLWAAIKRTFVWTTFLTIIYKLLPNCHVPYKAALTAGLIVGVILQILLKYYTYYVLFATNYKSVYGAMAALPTFLIWLQMSWLIVLFGGIISRRVLVGIQKV